MYHHHLSRKANPYSNQVSVNKKQAPTKNYAPLSNVVQRAQQDPKSVSGDEWRQLESAIGTRATQKILEGNKTSWFPEFKGISARFAEESGIVTPIQAKKKDEVNQQDNLVTAKNNNWFPEFKGVSAQFIEESGQVNELIQAKAKDDSKISETQPENKTGLPDRLKAGIENLSGYSMDNVKVHRNSDKPAQLNAHAYAQGTDIHLASGQEKHLPHEAWHVVQQMQGRVKPTMQMKGKVNVNDDAGLEKEADVMGAKALQAKLLDSKIHLTTVSALGEAVAQAAFSQTPLPNLKDSYHGGVHSQYDTARNVIEIHIDAGANKDGTLMQDFLTALWEARDAITVGQVRAPGGVFMRPGGAQVLKMTMEMLGESIGQREYLVAARNAKRVRNQVNEAPTAGDNILDHRLAPEHLSYRDSMVGIAGISMKPIGGGTSNGTENMLANNQAAINERALYDTAINELKPFLSIAVNINLAVVNQVIRMMEGKLGFLKLLYLKAMYAKNG